MQDAERASRTMDGQGQSGCQRKAHAKLNLGLRILGRRPDGFHDLESVFVPLELHDDLGGHFATQDSFTCSDSTLPTDSSNLVLKALAAWRNAAEIARLPGAHQSVALSLVKRIPAGAGLGGGSSDAAACLMLMNELFPPGLDYSTLHRLALNIGSDVPFFLMPGWAHVTGRGDLVTARDPVFNDVVLLVWPGIHVSTAWAYARLSDSLTKQGRYASFQGSRGFAAEREASTWPGNDFEAVVFAAHPLLVDLKQRLLDGGARFAAMSGSGSTVYGLFDSAQSASQLTQQLSSSYPIVVLTKPVGSVFPQGGGGKGSHENHRSQCEPPG